MFSLKNKNYVSNQHTLNSPSKYMNNRDNRKLLLSAKKGDKEKVIELLHIENIDINYKDEIGWSALHYACDEGNLKIVDILIKANADINAKSNDKRTPLHLAAKHGYFDISKLLYENGACLTSVDNEKNLPVHLCAMGNHTELLSYLLEHSTQCIYSKNLYGKTPCDLVTKDQTRNSIKNVIKNNKETNKTQFHRIKIHTTNTKQANSLIKPVNPPASYKIMVKNITYNNKYTKMLSNTKKPNAIGIMSININTSSIKTPNSKGKINYTSSSNTINPNVNISSNSQQQQQQQTQQGQVVHHNQQQQPIHNTKHLRLPDKLNGKGDNNSNNSNSNSTSNTPSVKKNYALKNTNTKRCDINIGTTNNTTSSSSSSSSNTNRLMMLNNKTIKLHMNNNNNNLTNCTPSHSYSQTKNKQNYINPVTAPSLSSTTSHRVNHNHSSVKKNTLVNHKTISLPKFNNIGMNDSARRWRSANKSNCISSKAKVANVEISLEYSQRNNISQTNDTNNYNNDNINIIENLNSNDIIKNVSIDKQQQQHPLSEEHYNEQHSLSNSHKHLLPQTKPNNEIVSLINMSGSSEDIEDQSQSLNEIDNNSNSNHNTSEGKNNSLTLSINTSVKQEKIGPSSFVCLGLLGRGSFGEVYLVKKKKCGTLYAMKVLDKDRIMAQNIFKYAMTERNILSLTSHPFIVKLNYAFQTNEKLFLLLDYCPGGDLAEQLSLQSHFSEAKAKFYLCEIILALGDLHQKDIIFRDLKPDNVVLDPEGHAMLTDFGLSREGVNDARIAKSFCGSVAYLAPEMVSRTGHGKAVDWYLLGVLFYEMLVGIPPFFTNNKEQIFRNIEKGELKVPDFVSAPATKLLRQLLKKDPQLRLGSKGDVEEIKANEYFKDVDWDKVYNRELKPPKVQKSENTVQMFKEPKLFVDDEDEVYMEENGGEGVTESNKNEGAQKFEGWSFVQNNLGVHNSEHY